MSDSNQFKTEELTILPGSGPVKKPAPPDATMAFDSNAKPESTKGGSGPQTIDSEHTHAYDKARPISSQSDTVGISPDSKLLSDGVNIPKHIAGYDILGVLGRGGMGVVYKARQRGLNRMAALKMILAAGHASSDEILRFQTEAEAVAKLQHPNIVQIFEVGENEGHPFFSLEYVDGGTLAGKLNNNPLAPRQAAELIEPLARAVFYAHENGILHRDLKPGNILLTLTGTPKITDFGLAKKMGDDSSNNTGTGSILGTPCYMAPEQAEGKIRELGPGADIYALGANLYHALTGRPPFMGETVLDTLQQVKNDDPVPPTRLQPKVPRDLETICMKCLQKEPHKRYITALELAEDLHRFLNNEPIKARPVSVFEWIFKWAKRRPQIAALLATLLFVVVGGFFGMMGLWFKAEGSRKEAERQAKNADEKADQATKAKKLAQERLDDSTRTLYAAQMNLAQDAIKEAKVNRLRDLLDRQDDKQRGFEWNYLKGILKSETLELKGHTSLVQTVAFRPPDGKQLASASGDGSIVLWEPDAAGSTPKFRFLKGHEGAVRRIAYSKDGFHLASAGEDGVIQYWNLREEGAHPGRIFKGHRHGVNSLAFGPNAEWIVSASDDGTLKIWPLTTEAPPITLKGHDYAVTDVATTADGKQIASASSDKTVRVWDVESRNQLYSCGHDHWVTNVAFSNDGETLASASWDKVLKIWDAKTGSFRMNLEGLPGPVRNLAFSPDGSRLAAACMDHSVLVWDLVTKKVLRNWPGEPGKVRTVAFSSDGQLLASVNFDLAKQDGRVLKSTSAVLGVAFGDGETLAGVGSDGSFTIWKVADGTPEADRRAQEGALRAVAYNTKRKLWATAAEDSTVALWKQPLDHGDLLKGHSRWVLSLAFDAAGNALASGGADGVIKLWNLDQLSTHQTLKAHTDSVLGLAFRTDGKRLASAGADRVVYLWNPTEGLKKIAKLDHDAPVLAVAFQPNTNLLATACADRTIKLWDSETGNLLHTLRGHTHAVTALAFSPDGFRLVSGSEDTTLKIWDPASGQETLSLRGHTQGITGLSFSPEGGRLASSSWDQTIRLWETSGERK